ncbi:gliding motility-associated ABC transporter permease subunit GldF [Zeaxanthinibacter sp. PT1]|uniref:gliding motility-associated ABC transporter permease subunit GldF n=1 Tax=Zeaxanthinibacter TaxID=561554 RepID=UPI00234B74EB|nr:gliding motility-associated ABC transporter permease subunit GldF [Zeaxanthinibacter sp. PT1]MDC6351319.1 gliding motility-associated ABC transporter permease subunit GldF [Zeaxanthinibacter sp. PT1]
MLAIFKREVTSFFTSPVAYLVIGLFLLLNGLFLWVFSGSYNIFEYGFADLGPFFLLSPWVLLLLIPAITMKSFAEEKKLGTLELLFIKPISISRMVMGKFFGALALVILALLPTLLYVVTISELGIAGSSPDGGVLLGSYIGLLLLAANYTAIGMFTSTLTENQIVAFILGLSLCFLMYYGFEGLAGLFEDGENVLAVEQLGMQAHFDSIARGVLDSRDLLYFLAATFLFLSLAIVRLQNQKR